MPFPQKNRMKSMGGKEINCGSQQSVVFGQDLYFLLDGDKVPRADNFLPRSRE
jgi:hypothetical protein